MVLAQLHLSVEPEMEQVFIACPDHITNPMILNENYLYCAIMPAIPSIIQSRKMRLVFILLLFLIKQLFIKAATSHAGTQLFS